MIADWLKSSQYHVQEKQIFCRRDTNESLKMTKTFARGATYDGLHCHFCVCSFCFDVAILDLVHDVEALHGLH